MSDKPPSDNATPSQASEGVIKVLAALTILALLVQGVVMLQSQVTYLTNLKPKKYRKQPPPAAASPGADKRPLITAPGRFTAAFKKHEEKRIKEAHGAGPGGGDNGYMRSKDGIIEMYRKHFNDQGIRDEEYIIVMSLEHSDTQWSYAMVEAGKALEDKNFDRAREAIKNALNNLDERHLIARARLLGMLSHIEYRAADPEAGRAAQRDSDETKIEVAKIFVRAMVEKREGGLTTAQGQAILDALADQRDEQENVARVSEIFSGPGEDPEKAPQRIMAMFKIILDGEERGDNSDG